MALTTSWPNVVHFRHGARHTGTRSTTEEATVTHRVARVAGPSQPNIAPKPALPHGRCDRTSYGGRVRFSDVPVSMRSWPYARTMAYVRAMVPL